MIMDIREWDIDEVWRDFDANGTTHDIDEFDEFVTSSYLKGVMINEGRNSPPTEDEIRMHRAIDKARRALSHMRPLKGKQHCVFCKSNKETHDIFSTHVVKDNEGRVTCPILRKYKCPICGATGSQAHTIKYCPFSEGMSVLDTLFRTPRNGSGRHRTTIPPSTNTAPQQSWTPMNYTQPSMTG